MGIIQEVKYKKGKKQYIKYQMTVDKQLIDRLSLKKGDRLDFNGELGGEVRFIIVRGKIEG